MDTPPIGIILRVLFWAALAATAYTYLLYPLLLALLCRLLKRTNMPRPVDRQPFDDHALPIVTMVISAYNEQAVLPDKIANCMSIDYPPDKMSFLIGSDGSADSTERILAELTDERFTTVINRVRRGKAQMINHLMPLVSCDIVVFSDANTMYDPDAIRQLVKPFSAARVGCVIGHLELTAPTGPAELCRTESVYWRYENRIKQMENVLGAVPSINGGIFAIRRELFEQLPVQAVTEDQVLGMRIMAKGRRCALADGARAHEPVSTWRGELRRRIRISAGNFQSLFLVPQILNPLCGRVHFAFVSHKLIRWLVPLFLLVMLLSNVMLAGEAFYGSTLLLQGLFYAGGLLGVLIPQMTGVVPVLSVPKYFLAMNVAILVGLARFLSKRQRVTWARTRPD